jgi:DNA primase
MIDAEIIKAPCDCRDVIEADLGKPKTRSARYNVYRCPLHRETNGYSFVVYADHWQCYGKCDKSGDVIAWIQIYHDLTFKQACNYLTRGISFKPSQPPRPHAPQESPAEPPSVEWQKAAGEVLFAAKENLWSKVGERAMAYLRNRGLWPETINRAELGYIPGDMRTWYKLQVGALTYKYPSGITIPWYADGALWGVNVRRPARPGEVKYQQFSGGHTKGALYWSHDICQGWPILFTEGEFDCLIAWQCGQDVVCPVTLGGASNPLHSRWLKLLSASARIVAVTDNDGAGDKAGDRLAALSARVKRIRVPQGKDMTDFLLATDMPTVSRWIQEVAA